MATRPGVQAIYDRLRGQIEAGDFAIGAGFPTEEQLCATHDVSRYALREALQRIEKEGFIRRRRGAGSTVLSRVPTNVFRHAVGSRADLLSYAHATRMRWERWSQISTDGPLARLLGCDELREWTVIDGIRFDDDGAPLGLVRAHVDPGRASIPPGTDFGGPLYEWLEQRFALKPVTLSQDVRAKSLSATEAEALGEATGASSLQIIRRYFDAGSAIYFISVNTYRARDFVYNMRLQLAD